MALIDGKYITVESESPSFPVTVTEQPVEKGITLIDHVQPQARMLSLSGVIVGPEAAKIRAYIIGAKDKGQIINYIGRNQFKGLITDFSTGHEYTIADGFTFSMELREIRIATSSYVDTLPAPIKTQAAKIVNSGTKQTKEKSSSKNKKTTTTKTKTKTTTTKKKKKRKKRFKRLSLRKVVSGGNNMKIIEIEKENIPYRFDISIADEIFTFEVHYNSDYDFFTVDLEGGGEQLVFGEKLIYGLPLFYDVQDNRFPKLLIVPWDESGNSTAVSWETLEASVFLYVMDKDEDNGE